MKRLHKTKISVYEASKIKMNIGIGSPIILKIESKMEPINDDKDVLLMR